MVKPVCTPDCPDRHPACSDRCEKYRAWKAEVQKEKTYTKSQNDAGKINGTTLTRSSGWAESTNNEPPAALDARGRGLWRRRERQAERVLPEGKLWRQAFELNKPFLFIVGVRGGRFGGLVYPLIL